MVAIALTVFYLYQFIYIVYAIFHRHVPALPDAKENHRFAIFISARNEQGVIFELLDSLTSQDYPKDRYDIYVVADNCTDNTAGVAREHVAPMINRLKNNITIKNPMLDEIKKQYKVMFDLTWLITGSISNALNVTITEDEIGFLTLHFLSALERHANTCY